MRNDFPNHPAGPMRTEPDPRVVVEIREHVEVLLGWLSCPQPAEAPSHGRPRIPTLESAVNYLAPLLVLLLLLAATPPRAAAETLRVGIAELEPCVMQEQGRWTGFEVELWKRVAADLRVETEYRPMAFQELLAAVEEGSVDVGIAGITITSERELAMDFSVPTVEAGYLILTRPAAELGILAILVNLLTMKAVWQGLILFAVFLALTGVVLWWSERGSDAIHDQFSVGIWDGIWLAFATATTVGYGDVAPKNKVGKLTAVLVCLGGAIVFSIAVGAISAATTVDRLQSRIVHPSDLLGRRVATKAGTTSQAVLEDFRTIVVTTPTIRDAYQKLLADEVEAVVFDAPNIMYFAQFHADEVAIGGRPFDSQYYAFALGKRNPLRKRINRSLLKLREQGVYEQLHTRWFGK